MLWWTLRQLKASKPPVREAAARKLGELGAVRAVPGLVELLHDEEVAVRKAAAGALSLIPDPAAVGPLVARLGTKGNSSGGKRPASGGSADAEELRIVAQALAGQGKAAVESLCGLLRSENKDARRWAAHALGLIGDAGGLDGLISCLKDDRSSVRSEAAAALGRVKDHRAVAPLVEALSHRDAETRRAAAEALAGLGGEDVLEALESATRDQDQGVQLAAVDSLCSIGTVRAILGLRWAVESAKKAVRDRAASFLNVAAFEAADARERAAVAVMRGDIQAALREGPAALFPLAGMLDSKNTARRLQAVEGLAALRSDEAVDCLVRALRDVDPSVRQAAADGLSSVGLAAAEQLRKAAASEDVSVQRLAACALGGLRDAGSAGALAGIIDRNRRASADYSEPLEAAKAAAGASEILLRECASSISEGDLTFISELPDGILECWTDQGLRPFREQLAVDCAPLRRMALEELSRRKK